MNRQIKNRSLFSRFCFKPSVSILLLAAFASPLVYANDSDDGWATVGDGWEAVNSSANPNTSAGNNLKAHSPENADSRAIEESLQEFSQSQARALIFDVETNDNDESEVEVISNPVVVNSETRNSRQSDENLDMFVGQILMLGKVDVSRVAIGNGSIVRAEILKTDELLLIGQQEGSTSLRLWNKDNTQSSYNIRVEAQDPETRVRMERMVRMRVRMVEFNKRAIGELGIDWGNGGVANGPTFAFAGDAISNNLFRPANEAIAGLPNSVEPFAGFLGIATEVTSRINFLAGNGDAVTLAEPVLSAMNGGRASFLAGGEIPFQSVGADGQTSVEFKEYGIRLNVAPSIDSGGNIRTSVETEISQVDAAVSINGTPGLLTRRAQTEVNVRSGETIVLAGLLSSENSNDTSGIPGIRNLPIIGRFFSTHGKSNEVRELVIFITPEVVDPENLVDTNSRRMYDLGTKRVDAIRSALPLME